VHAHLLLLVLLAMELSLLCQMCDLHFTFEEDRTKTAVAIEDDMYLGQTYIQVILYLSNAIRCIGQTTTMHCQNAENAQCHFFIRTAQ